MPTDSNVHNSCGGYDSAQSHSQNLICLRTVPSQCQKFQRRIIAMIRCAFSANNKFSGLLQMWIAIKKQVFSASQVSHIIEASTVIAFL